MDTYILITILSAFIYGAKHGYDYFGEKGGPLSLLVLVYNAVLFPVLATARLFTDKV